MFNWIKRSHKKEVSLTLADYFTDIFVRNAWMSSESASGFGSTLSQTENLRKDLGFIIDQLAIQSIVDIPWAIVRLFRNEKVANFIHHFPDCGCKGGICTMIWFGF